MALLLLMPAVVSFLLIAAHFLRTSQFPLVLLSLTLPCLLFMRRRWIARAIQLALICAALEWVRTLVTILNVRIAHGEPYLRMTLFLGAVIALTLGSALAFLSPTMRKRYKLVA